MNGLAAKLARLAPAAPLKVRWATVTAVGSGTVTVSLDGTEVVVPRMAHYSPTVGDVARLSVCGADVWAEGALA